MTLFYSETGIFSLCYSDNHGVMHTLTLYYPYIVPLGNTRCLWLYKDEVMKPYRNMTSHCFMYWEKVLWVGHFNAIMNFYFVSATFWNSDHHVDNNILSLYHSGSYITMLWHSCSSCIHIWHFTYRLSFTHRDDYRSVSYTRANWSVGG